MVNGDCSSIAHCILLSLTTVLAASSSFWRAFRVVLGSWASPLRNFVSPVRNLARSSCVWPVDSRLMVLKGTFGSNSLESALLLLIMRCFLRDSLVTNDLFTCIQRWVPLFHRVDVLTYHHALTQLILISTGRRTVFSCSILNSCVIPLYCT